MIKKEENILALITFKTSQILVYRQKPLYKLNNAKDDTLININPGQDMELLLQQTSDFNGFEIDCFLDI